MPISSESLELAVAIFLLLDTAIGLVLMLYLGLFGIKKIDNFLYGKDHPILEAWKNGGLYLSVLRAGEYGWKFLISYIRPNWCQSLYPAGRSISDVPHKHRMLFIALVMAGNLLFVFGIPLYLFAD